MNYSMPMSGTVVANAPADVRADFIRRVYGLFFMGILVTVLVGAYCAQPSVAPAMLRALPVLFIALLVCGLILAFVRRTSGVNVALLYLFAAIEGAIAGPALTLLNRVAPGIPAEAAILTATVFAGLSVFALSSRTDFSFLGGFLTVALIALIVGGLLMFFIHSAMLQTLYAIAGVVIFSGYVLYDTSMIMRRLAPDEAIVGAVSLYLDLVNLFWLILQLLLEFSGNRD